MSKNIDRLLNLNLNNFCNKIIKIITQNEKDFSKNAFDT